MDLLNEFKKLNKSVDELKEMLTSQKETSKTSDFPELITLKEVCKILGVTERCIWTKRKSGEIRTIAKGNRVYIAKEEFQRYINTRTQFNKKNTKNKPEQL